MHFTEGHLREYERLMQEKPGYDRKYIKTMKERECKHCPYFHKGFNKCSREKCALFDD